MKLKDKLVLRKIAENWVVLPLAASTFDLNGLLMLNDTGAMLWQKMEQGADFDCLVGALIDEYEVSPDTATEDVKAFLQKLSDAGCIEE